MNIIKSVLAAVFIHLLAFSLIWVGFPVLIPGKRVQFYYTYLDIASDGLINDTVLNRGERSSVIIKSTDAGLFKPWIKARNIEKPRR